MTVQKKIKSNPDVINYFKELPFCNKYIEKPEINFLNLLFMKKKSVIKTDQPFKGYVMSYKVELINKKNLLIQLEASKRIIKDFFNDLLDETKSV